jgi:hypothetical protein
MGPEPIAGQPEGKACPIEYEKLDFQARIVLQLKRDKSGGDVANLIEQTPMTAHPTPGRPSHLGLSSRASKALDAP